MVDLTMALSPHFILGEMLVSQTGARLGLRNVPRPEHVEALRLLCVNVLEPVRVHYGQPVLVSSGYRSPAVNRAVGGSRTSQHTKGEAADFTVRGVPNIDVCRWLHRYRNYDQLIYEFGAAGWVHVSWSATRMRNMELTAKRKGGRVVYLPGIVP